MLRMMSTTSSLTPGIVENSWLTPSTLIFVTAAPVSPLSITRRKRVAYGVPEAPRQRLGDERPALALFFFHPETGRCYVQHRQKTTC